jgi:hypothetical protein
VTPGEWAQALITIAVLLGAAYTTARLLDERATDKAHRQRMIDDHNWAVLMRAVSRARHDFRA